MGALSAGSRRGPLPTTLRLLLVAVVTLLLAGSVLAERLADPLGASWSIAVPAWIVGALAAGTLGAAVGRLRSAGLALLQVRGVGAGRRLWWSTADLLPLVIVGAAVGILAGLVAAGPLADRLDVEPADVGADAWLRAALVSVGLLGCLLVGTWQGGAERRVDDVTGRPVPARSSYLVTVLRLAIWPVTALVLFHALSEADDTPSWEAWSGPVVLGLAAAELLIWLAAPAGRLLRRIVAPDSLDDWLVSRWLGRGGDLAGPTRLIVAGTVLLAVAISAVVTTDRHLEESARVEVGAAERYAFEDGAVQAMALAQSVDPSGAYVAAGAVMAPGTAPDDPGGTLYLDAARAGRVLDLAGTPAADVPGLLRGLGNRARTTRADQLVAMGVVQAGARLTLDVRYVNDDDSPADATVVLNGADPTPQRARVRVDGCDDRCVLLGVTIRTAGRVEKAGDGSPLGDVRSLRFGSLDIARAVDWVPRRAKTDNGFSADDGGWYFEATSRTISLTPPGLADLLPVLSAHRTFLPTVATLAAVDRPIGSAEQVPALPLLGTDGLLVDLGAALVDGGAVPAVDVFLLSAADAPASVRDRLVDELGEPVTVADARRDLGARSPWLLLVLAVLTLLVACCAALAARPRIAERARAGDDALRASGVQLTTLRRAHGRTGGWRTLTLLLLIVAASWASIGLLGDDLPVAPSTRWVGQVDRSVPWLLVWLVAAAGAIAWWAVAALRTGVRRGRGQGARDSALGSIVWRGVRHRWLISSGTVLLLTLAIGSAVLGPVFADAAVRSYLTTRLDDQPARQTSLEWTLTSDGTTTATGTAESFAPSLDHAVAGEATGSPWQSPDVTVTGLVRATAPLENAAPIDPLPRYRLLARAGACDQLELTGRCPTAAGEVLVPEPELALLGVSVGDSLGTGSGELTVVGSYQPPSADDDSFWLRPEEFTHTPVAENFNLGLSPATTAALITPVATFDELRGIDWTILANSRIVTGEDLSIATLDDAIESADALAEAPPTVPGGTLELTPTAANLQSVRADLDGQQSAARAAVAPAVLSLVLVALALLLRLLSAAAQQRQPELALASLRGSSRATLWRLALAEPLLLIAVAIPAGLAAGLGLCVSLARSWLAPGTGLHFGPIPALAAGAVILAAVGVAVAATRQSLRIPLADQLSGVTRPARQARGAVIGVVILVAALVALVVTRLGTGDDDPQPTDLLIPMAIAVLCGIVLTWLIGLAARAVIRSRAADRPLTGFLLARSVGRRRENTLLVLPLVTALGICGLAIGVYGAAGQWWSSVATTRAPADQVWSSAESPQRTLDLTQRVDPDGEWTMAISQYRAAGNAGTEAFRATLVDSTRLGTVGTWWDQWAPGSDADDVREALDAFDPPELTARRIGAEVDNQTGSEIYIYVRYLGKGGRTAGTNLGPYPDGESTSLDARLPGCRQTCQLVDLQIGRKAGFATMMSGDVTVVPRLDGEVWDEPARARSTTPGTGGASSPVRSVSTDGASIAATIDTGGGDGLATLSYVPDSAVIPVVVGADADRLLLSDGDGGTTVRMGPRTLTVDPVLESGSIPLGGPRDLLADIRPFRDELPDSTELATSWILVRDGAPDDVLGGLRGAGAEPLTTFDAELRAQESSAFALALRLYIVVAGLVLVMALAAVAITTAVQLPDRRRDAAALRVVGVRRRLITRAILLEEAILLALSVVVGVGSGALSALLLVGTLSLGPGDDPDLPDVVPELDGVGLGILAAAVFAGLFVIGAIAAARTVRSARGATLRESAR